MAMASLSRAKKDPALVNRAVGLFRQIIDYYTTPGMIEPKFDHLTRPMKGLSMPVIIISIAQVLREAVDDPICEEWINRSIKEIRDDFMNRRYEAVLEVAGPNGRKVSANTLTNYRLLVEKVSDFK